MISRSPPPFWQRLRESVQFLSLAFLPFQGRARTLYRALQPYNLLTRDTLYVNLGYWRDDPPDLDAACQALADLLADTAALVPSDSILDVGCGYADQDLRWVRTGRVARVVGLNLSESQVAIGRARVQAAGLQDRIELVQGDAVRLPFEAASFDAVVALESAFHFRPRAAFLHEAARVLRPGGRLGLADLCGVERPLSVGDRLGLQMGRSFWQIPADNLEPAAAYRASLEAAGFEAVHIESIAPHTHPGFGAHARIRLEEPELARRMNPAYRWLLRTSLATQARRPRPPLMDYVLVSARRR